MESITIVTWQTFSSCCCHDNPADTGHFIYKHPHMHCTHMELTVSHMKNKDLFTSFSSSP